MKKRLLTTISILLIVLVMLPFFRSIDVIPTNALYTALASACVFAIKVNRHKYLSSDEKSEDNDNIE